MGGQRLCQFFRLASGSSFTEFADLFARSAGRAPSIAAQGFHCQVATQCFLGEILATGGERWNFKL